MTLEDFFTLTEMKNGLSTLRRVEELISMLQKKKDCVLTNVGDTARQWSTVASNLAATENKDCLSLFVQLNGLCFLNQWLQEALKCSNDLTDSAVEELINTLLGSFERLPIDREKFNASGIRITVEQLLGYKSLNINERARILFERWDHAKVSDDSYQDLEKGGTCQDDKPKPSADADTVDGVHSMHPVLDISPSKEWTEEGDCGVKSAGTESHYLNVTRCPDSSQLDTDNDIKTSTSNQIIHDSSSNLTEASVNIGNMNSLASAILSNSCQENFSITKESSVCPAVAMASTGACYSLNARERDVDDQCDASVFKDVDAVKELKMEVNTKEGRPCKSGKKESFNVSSSSGLSASSPARKPERTVSCNFDSKDSRSCLSDAIGPRPRSASVDCMVPKYLRTMELKPIMQDLSSNGRKLRKIDGPRNSFHKIEVVGSASEVEELGSESNFKVCNVADTVIPHDSSQTVEMKSTGEMGQRSELGLEDGEIDALEVAWQVAIEVEREVVDYREPFCSSSPEVSSGEIVSTRSHDIVEEDKQDQQLNRDMQDQPVNEELNGNVSPTGNDLSDGASSRLSETEIYSEKCDQDLGLQKPTTLDEESGGKNDQKKCDFDLNEDVCTEEFNFSMNPIPNNSVSVSAPIAVVAASKGAPVLPGTPLHFEGELGWKGSAATSAFRPASPRRTPDGEKTCSGPKQKANFILIDLNVAESGDDVVVDPTSTKEVPVSSGFPSRDSSVEVSSGRAERLKLDLNRLGDEDVSPHSSSCWRLPHQNGDPTLCPASSSSSRQPSVRDFDLNDNPCFFDAGGSDNLNKSSSKALDMYGSSKLDDPVITLMGSKLAVERKDCTNQAQQSFMGSGPGMAATMAARPMLSYARIPPAYGYNGLGAGPAMTFPPAVYGPGSIPYMVDSRGAAVIPQILGSAVLNTAPSAAPPILMSVTNAPSGLNGAGPSQSGLHLNSGMTLMESGLMEEQAKTASQHTTASGVSLKRKEPESGWEPYAFGYKQGSLISGGALGDLKGLNVYMIGHLRRWMGQSHPVGVTLEI